MMRRAPVGRRYALAARHMPLLAESLAMIAVAAACLALLPFRQVAHRVVGKPPASSRPASPEEIARIRWALAAVARRVPWRAKCFEQGLAAYWMLRRRRIAATLHYGALLRDGAVAGHVWVSAGDTIVTGGDVREGFQEVLTLPQGS